MEKVLFSDESMFKISMTTKGRLLRQGSNTNIYDKKFTAESKNFPSSF